MGDVEVKWEVSKLLADGTVVVAGSEESDRLVEDIDRLCSIRKLRVKVVNS